MKMNKKKIGIVTWHYYPNYGSVLQAYALQKTVELLGYEARVINYRNPKYGKCSEKKDKLRIFLINFSKMFSHKLLLRINDPFLVFRKKFLKETKRFYKIQEIKKYENLDSYYAIICGSDQIWAPNVFNPVYMLEFVPQNVKKISYAASIGLDDIPDNLISTYSQLLSDFDKVLVRENMGKELLISKCKIKSEVVVDPTLLMDISNWKKIEQKQKYTKEGYIFCYFLNNNHAYQGKVEEFAKRKRLQILGISANKKDAEWMNILENVGPREFLGLIDSSDFIFTDSYHGTIFSLIYNKKFITFKRFTDSDKICQNSRIYQLSNWFGIENIIKEIEEYNPELDHKIDYKEINLLRKELKEKSVRYLQEALK